VRSVYLIRGNDSNYKIGIAKNPKQRLKQLQTGNSDKLTLVETYQSEHASKIERALHNWYGFARNEGEWFDLSITVESDFVRKCRQIDESLTVLKEAGNPFL
jgi:hypothetical protein